MKIFVKNKKRKIAINVKKLGNFSKYLGLMFKSRNTENLLFDYPTNSRQAIHSWFCFFDFLIIWLDGKNKVMEKQIVSPFTGYVQPKKAYRRFVEVPVNAKNSKIIDFFVGK